ncbi:MAG: hypothetical protein ACK4V6_13900 [Microthrixaceae bacterium]
MEGIDTDAPAVAPRPPELRALGEALSGMGIPWLLTLVGMSGMTSPGGMMIVPLLWLAPPFLLLRLHRATSSIDGAARGLLKSALAVGLACWVVAMPASLLGNQLVTRTFFWFGISGGALLYCVAMLWLTRTLGWSAYERRWRTATTVEWVSLVGLLMATAIVLPSGTRRADGTMVADAVWVSVLVGALAVISLIAVVLLARIHRSTWEAMASAPPGPPSRERTPSPAARSPEPAPAPNLPPRCTTPTPDR